MARKVHEPGSTPLGTHLREYLLSKRPLSKEAELLLFEAARAQLVNEEIRPQLDQGVTIIADRFEASTVAYQGYGRRIDLDVVYRLNSFATQGILPDVSFLLDIDPAEGLRRVGHPQLTLPLDPTEDSRPGRQDVQGQRRFEDQPLQFHNRVRKGFLEIAHENPERWVMIDASKAQEKVSDEIWRHVLERLELPAAR
jgi:dTMP kinase